MARTTSGAVQAVLAGGKDYDTEERPSLQPYIRAASLIVDRVVACAVRKGIALTTDEAAEVECWLAAHAYAMSDQPYTSRSTANGSGQFQGQTGMHLEATKYGQMATRLDPSGCLEAIGKRKTASAGWLGKTLPEAIDYDTRNGGW